MDQIYVSRIWPLDLESGMCLCIYSPSETLTRSGGNRPGTRRTTRLMNVRAVLIAPAPSTPDEAFEAKIADVATTIEERICSNPHLRLPDGAAWSRDTELKQVGSGFDASNPRLVIQSLDFLVTADHQEGQPRTLFTAS